MKSSASPDLTDRPRADVAIVRALDLLVGDDSRLGVAVSGGSDSLALLVHTSRWANNRNRSLFAATVDHGLRPEAAAEADLVASICSDLGLPHETLTWKPPDKRIAQSAARGARYALLTDWAVRQRLPAIALGHTQDDRLETFLIRARAGSGWFGLAGPMPAAPASLPASRPLRLIRPLLTTTRAQLQAELTSDGLDWIDDPTNHQPRHERVRMRSLLRATPSATRQSILRSMNQLARLRAATVGTARETLETEVEISPDRAVVAPGALDRLPHQARLRLIEALVQSFIPRPSPPRADRLARLVTTLVGSQTNQRSTLGGCQFTRSNRGIAVAPAPPRRTVTSQPTTCANPVQRARELLMDPLAGLLLSEE